VNGKEHILTPGAIELHAQFGEPGYEYREDIGSGLRAAAAGGFSRVCCQPETQPINDRRSITEAMLSRARDVGLGTLYPLTAGTVGLDGKQLAEIGDALDAGAIAISCGRRYVRDSSVMRRLLEYCHSFDALVMQQPQEASLAAHAIMHEGALSTRLGLRGCPRAAEEIALARDLALCALTKTRYHAICITSRKGVAMLKQAKAEGVPATADVTPHHLLLLDDSLRDYDERFRVDPPLREDSDRQALREALADGTIDCISSDHAPQSALETQCELEMTEPGMSGLEFCFPLIWKLVTDGVLSASRAVDALSARPSMILGVDTPSLKEGATADFTLFDPNLCWVPLAKDLRSKGKNSPFVGAELTGRVTMTASGGRLTFDRSNHQDAV
jgi:dihydroorotase